MNISFSLTTDQVKRGFETGKIEKDVTRRMGWLRLKAGDILVACRKCMGRKKGEPLEVLGNIKVVSVRREKLRMMIDDIYYGIREVEREGFEAYEEYRNPEKWVEWFCSTHKCTPENEITRIEFTYL